MKTAELISPKNKVDPSSEMEYFENIMNNKKDVP